MRPIGPPLPPAPPMLPAQLGRVSAFADNKIGTVSGTSDASNDFASLIVGKFDEVNAMQTDADSMVHEMLTGGDVNQAEVLTAVQKADLAFRMMLQVRNKLIEAYRELQQIQI
ncbi:MAG: flagellar hook-basal body complex protein FliE [Planctomycetaceae bacterium]